MKPHVRVLGFDDAPFSFRSGKVLVIGVVMRLPGYVEGVIRTECSVDGDDATDALVASVSRSRFREQIKMIMIDGVALGGFNVVDIAKLHRGTGIPVATITRDAPDMDAIWLALKKHFGDWERRYALIKGRQLHEVDTGHHPLHVSVEGMSEEDADAIIRESVVRGALPEVLRVAHVIASGVAKGESKGKA